MALAFDAASGTQGTAVSSLSWSHTCSGVDRLLFAGAGNSSGTIATVSGITFNSVAMTVVFSLTDDAPAARSSLYRMVNPPTGSLTVAVTYSATQDEVGGASCSFTGVDQVTPIDTPATNFGTTSPATVAVTSATGDLVVDCVYWVRTAITVGALQTSRQEQENIGGFSSLGMSTEPGGATITMSWTSTNARWATGGVSINPSTALPRLGDSNAALT